jgi:uncharacterized protein
VTEAVATVAVRSEATSSLHTETLIARGALAIVAIHVVDANFLQPRAGTNARDHLVSGFVLLAAFLGTAMAYPRLRAGVGAALAIFLGLLATVMGATGGAYWVREVGASGDDYTVLLAIPAGLSLLGVGLVTLWGSRRLDDSLARRYARRALLAAAGAVVFFEIVFPILFAYGATHVLRAKVPAPELGAAYEDVSFTTSDGLRLEGWYVPSRNRAAVIAFPGRKGPQRHTPMLARHGYGVLLFDRRGEGASEGDGNSFGWGGEKDVYAAIDYLWSRPDVDATRIGGIGLSVGGEMMLQAAAERGGLAAAVSEGAGTRTFSEDVRAFSGLTRLAGMPFLAFKTVGVALFANRLPPPPLFELVPEIAPTPVLLIWSPKGAGENLNERYYRLAREAKSIWAVPDAGHTDGIEARPHEYERRVIGFFDRALLKADPTETRTP